MIYAHVYNYKGRSVQWLVKLSLKCNMYLGVDALSMLTVSLSFVNAVKVATYIRITTCKHACTCTVLLKAMLHSFTVFLQQTASFN